MKSFSSNNAKTFGNMFVFVLLCFAKAFDSFFWWWIFVDDGFLWMFQRWRFYDFTPIILFTHSVILIWFFIWYIFPPVWVQIHSMSFYKFPLYILFSYFRPIYNDQHSRDNNNVLTTNNNNDGQQTTTTMDNNIDEQTIIPDESIHLIHYTGSIDSGRLNQTAAI